MSREARTAPRPPYIDTALPGYCRLCGEVIVEQGKVNNRKRWHPVCALTWVIMNNPQEARRFIFQRDGGVCRRKDAKCCGPWELDHIVPLSRSGGLQQYWRAANMQTLCRYHHAEKTREDRLTA